MVNGKAAGRPFLIRVVALCSRFTIHHLPFGAVAGAALIAAIPAAGAADLLDIYRLARESDPVYASARATWAATQERLVQARAGLLPQATLSASTQYNDRDIDFRNPAQPSAVGQFNSNSISVSITQPIYRKENLVTYEQSKIQVEQADSQIALAAQDLILRVAQAYFDVLLSRDTVAFAEAQKKAIAEQLAQAKRNFEVGTATITDTHEAQARYDLTVAQEIAAQNDLEIRRRQLAQIIGRTAPTLAKLGTNRILALPSPNDASQWVDRASSGNLQVQVSEAALRIAREEIDKARGGHYPTVDAFASYTDSGSGSGIQGGFGTDQNNTIIGVQLALPLYSGGAVSSRVRETLALHDRARQDLETARRNAELAARQAFLGVANGVAQVKALEAALVSSQSSLDSTRLGREVGVRTQVDVLNAQQQLFSTRRDLAQATYNYILSLLRLNAAVGTLSEADLMRVNSWLSRK